MTSVDAIVMERYVKETEGLQKLNFTKKKKKKKCVVIAAISKDFVCGVIAGADVKNKQDGGRRISSLRRKTGRVYANFLER